VREQWHFCVITSVQPTDCKITDGGRELAVNIDYFENKKAKWD
jgi:hypothetical protein